MISYEHQCIFVHIPKCAGTSIETALGHLDGYEGRGGQDHRSIRMIEPPMPLFRSLSSKENLRELYRRAKEQCNKKYNPKNRLMVSPEQYRNYYKFSIVRNPWARASSWYNNVMRDQVHLRNKKLSADVTFNEFLKQHAGEGMLQTQMYWLKSFDGDINLDFVGRFENLNDDFKTISKEAGFPDIQLPHKMKGRAETSDYRRFYDNETYDLIARVYSKEIAYFDYSFEKESVSRLRGAVTGASLRKFTSKPKLKIPEYG